MIMRRPAPLSRLVPLLALFFLVSPPSMPSASQGAGGRFVTHTVTATQLKGNLLGDSLLQDSSVYLPAGYDSGTARYPVVYLFHGFSDSHKEWEPRLKPVLDRLMSERRLPPMIFVLPNGRNAYLSSYFTNSKTAGNWEDYVVRDLVPDIDRRYRTLEDARGRGITGYSKGGFVALRMAMRHPEVFSSAYAISPCCLSLTEAVRGAKAASWEAVAAFRTRQEFDTFFQAIEKSPNESAFFTIGIVALAAAISPDPAKPPLFIDLPFGLVDGALAPREPAYSAWEAASLVNEVSRFAANHKRLRALGIEVGANDGFADIPQSVRSFSRALERAGIKHALDIYDGRHEDRILERLPDHMLPFFARTLIHH
jgi:enterochelin esterase-like enzyme